ncbi:MAG: endolytic transglycosylase MltG [Candidatus Aminicenantes bacterium]|nr:endolytic transglycosylase MltG [Candidatus Aminicenantes bacterium]
MKRPIRTLLEALVVLGLAGLLGGAGWLAWESRAPENGGKGIVIFEVEKGQSVRSVAESLKTRGLIRKTAPLLLWYNLFHHSRSIKAGEYALPAGRDVREVLETLVRGKIYLHPVTVAEGLTAAETFDVFLAASFGTPEGFAAAFRDTAEITLIDPGAEDLEGYLFPETYRLPKGASASDILAGMVYQFKDIFGPNERARAADIGLTPRQAVVLASLIEEETALAREKPLVSAVFHNRLRAGMKLECDPTVIYALKKAGPFSRALTRKDLKFDSPYNTYLYPGLPPGPICNPGKDSLRAAIRPAGVDYLFFVANREGGHTFSRTLKEHLAAVRAYRGR